MSQFYTLKEVRNEIVRSQFGKVSVFSSIHPGNKLFKDLIPYYKFQVSKTNLRKETLLKKDFPNTSSIYKMIKEDFIKGKKIISIEHKRKKLEIEYEGIQLENNKGENLEIYFSKMAMQEYQKEKEKFTKIRMYDFYRYARKAIKKDIVDTMTIRPSFIKRSQVLYILNNLETSSLLKEKYLGYHYEKGNPLDYFIISDLIRYFINSHIEENPKYIYNEDAQYQTVSLKICFESGKVIEIIGNDLIDFLEKNRLIDDLYDLNKKDINKMPKTKILKRSEYYEK